MIGAEEIEVKVPVRNRRSCEERLRASGLTPSQPITEVDEYYDDAEGTLAARDYVVRLRTAAEAAYVALKGPRNYDELGIYSRIELEVPAGPPDLVRESLLARGFRRAWVLEKQRVYWSSSRHGTFVALDTIPYVGLFLEVEGERDSIDGMLAVLADGVGQAEPRNYSELVRDFLLAEGVDPESITGATFSDRRK